MDRSAASVIAVIATVPTPSNLRASAFAAGNVNVAPVPTDVMCVAEAGGKLPVVNVRSADT